MQPVSARAATHAAGKATSALQPLWLFRPACLVLQDTKCSTKAHNLQILQMAGALNVLCTLTHHVNARLQCTETLATVFDGNLWVQLSCASTLFICNDSGVLEAAAA